MDLTDSDEQLDPEDFKKSDAASLWAPLCGEGEKDEEFYLWPQLQEKSREQMSSQPRLAYRNFYLGKMPSAVPAAFTLERQPSNLGSRCSRAIAISLTHGKELTWCTPVRCANSCSSS